MANQATEYIVREHPEYIEVSGLLSLAAKTWPLFGISAGDLVGITDFEQDLIRIYVEA